MGAYTCEYGVVHKVCRCPTPHTIKCDKVEEHKGHNYVPKHKKEPVVKYRVEFMESERGWGQDYWHVDYDTKEEADRAFTETNARNTATHAPDYYIKALSVKPVTE